MVRTSGQPGLPCSAVPLFTLLSFAFFNAVMAQEPAAEPAQPTAEEAYASAAAELDRAEQLDQADLTPAVLTEINRRLVTLQGVDANHPRLPYLFGRMYALAGRGGDAIEQIQRFVATREGRNEWEAHRRLGDLFVEEFPRLAQGSYERARVLKSNEPTVLVGLSTCAYKVGRLDDAVGLAKEAVDADGRKNVRVVSHLARMLIAKQQWADAEAAATQAMSLAEADVKAKPGARRPLRVLDQQYQLVVDLIQARINDKVASADDYVRMADFIRRRSDVSARMSLHEALRVVENGVKATAPNTLPKLLERHAVLLAEVGRTEEAIAAFEKLLAADPGNATANEGLDRLRKQTE